MSVKQVTLFFDHRSRKKVNFVVVGGGFSSISYQIVAVSLGSLVLSKSSCN